MKPLFLLLLILLLAACTSQGLAPVTDGWQQPIAKQGFVTVENDDDTLYSIAFRYGHDFRELAETNHLQAPYELTKGQRIYLVAPVSAEQVKSKSAQPVIPKPVAKKPAPKPRTSVKQPKFRNVATIPAREKVINKAIPGWHWPTQGRVLKGFGKHNKGIDIIGRVGQPIYAVAGGQVVYSGAGLPGYGRLLIIKHNNEYLSAYAHNKRLLVQQGRRVKAGQKIAEMGSSGAQRVKLHFELRKAGKPVDPIRYLPTHR